MPPLPWTRFGKGFYTIKTTNEEAVRNLTFFSPYRSPFGLYSFQRWVPDFDPNAEREIKSENVRTAEPAGLVISTWITLRNLQEEFRGVTQQNVTGLEEVIGVSSDNIDSKDPKFCVGLQSRVRWVHAVIVTNSHTKSKSMVLIDYHHLLIRCRYCGDTTHYSQDCLLRPGPRRTTTRPRLREDKKHRPMALADSETQHPYTAGVRRGPS
jgi:hypothetical protein